MHSTTSLEEGRTIEQECAILLRQAGFPVKRTTESEDIKDHIDLIILCNLDEIDHIYRIGVDVKGNKIYHDEGEDYRFVELKNVKGELGSLYGKSHFIAFQEPDGFLFVNRSQLAKFISDNVDTSIINTSFYPVHLNYLKQYRSHTNTQNRKDILTLIKLSDLRKFKSFKLFTNGKIKKWK